MEEKGTNIAENELELIKKRQKLAETNQQKPIIEPFSFENDNLEATSLRLTAELRKKLDQFVAKSGKFRDRSALLRTILSRFFNENDPVSAEFRSFFE